MISGWELHLSERDEIALAYHEAGHAVAAWALGRVLYCATIVGTADSAGWVTWEDPLKNVDYPNMDVVPTEVISEARLNAILTLAGPAAQHRYDPSTCEPHQGSADARQVAHWAFEIFGDDEGAAWLESLLVEVDRILGERWKAVEAVVACLLKKKTLESGELKQAIEGA